MVFRLAEFVPAAATGADAVCVTGFVVEEESVGSDARGRVGECLLELNGASCFGGPVSSLGKF